MTRQNIIWFSIKWDVNDFLDEVDFVKRVLDSKDSTKDFDFEGISLLKGVIYRVKNDEIRFNKIKRGVISLLTDSDYSCDAIPVAAELGLEEAKDFFLYLSKKSIEELRDIKTSDFINAYFCLLNFTRHNLDKFLPLIKSKIKNENLNTHEYASSLDLITQFEPLWIIDNLKTHIEHSIDLNNQSNYYPYVFNVLVSRVLQKKGILYLTQIISNLKDSNKQIKNLLCGYINKYVISQKEYSKFGNDLLKELTAG